jgi:cobalamin biosynthetic protein CobC
MRDHGGNIDAAKRQFGGEDWIDLSTGINRVPYPVRAPNAAAWATLPTRSAMRGLCDQACETYRVAHAAAIVPLAGAQGAIQLIPHLRAPGKARVLGPTYNEHAAALIGAGWDVEIVSNLAQIAGADLGVVVNPNNPGGQIYSPDALLALKDDVQTLVIDESFADAMPELSCAPFAGQEGLFILRSFGKFYGLAGVRLGFAIGATKQIDRLRDMAGPWPISGPAIEIGTQALADKEWAAHTITRLRAECLRIDTIASRWDFVGGCELFRLYSCENATDAQNQLARHRIWSRIFPWSDRLIRLGLPGCEDEWHRFETAMGQL